MVKVIHTFFFQSEFKSESDTLDARNKICTNKSMSLIDRLEKVCSESGKGLDKCKNEIKKRTKFLFDLTIIYHEMDDFYYQSDESKIKRFKIKMLVFYNIH